MDNVKPFEKKRKIHIDVLRIFALFLVVYAHTGDRGFNLFVQQRGQISYWLQLGWTTVSVTAVPFYLSISGAMQLNRNESYKRLFTHRILKYTIILLLASLAVYTFKRLVTHEMADIKGFFTTFYTDSLQTSYWFLYVYLAFLCMLPFIRYIAQNMKTSDFIWLFSAYFFMQFLKVLDFALFKGEMAHNNNFSFFITTSYIIYPFVGYFIENRLPKKYFNIEIALGVVVAWLLGIVWMSRLADWYCVTSNRMYVGAYNYFIQAFNIINVFCVYYLLKCIFDNVKLSQKASNVIQKIAATTFIVYLFEGIFKHYLSPVYDFFSPIVGAYPACFIFVTAVCVVGCGVSFILQTIYRTVLKRAET